jgi:hypothetical protein
MAKQKENEMNRIEHKQRHVELHRALDELIADWITHTDKRPSSATVFDLMSWSHEQTQNPTEEEPRTDIIED